MRKNYSHQISQFQYLQVAPTLKNAYTVFHDTRWAKFYQDPVHDPEKHNPDGHDPE